MNIFKQKTKNEHPNEYLNHPTKPWLKYTVIAGAGIIASGWTNNNKVFLLSTDGYSVTEPITGERIIRNRDEDNTAFDKLSKDNLEVLIF